MATTTTIISGQSIGTSSNKGDALFPTKLSLSSLTAAVVLTIRVTNGAGVGSLDGRTPLWLRYAFSPISVAAEAAPSLLRQNSRYVELKLSQVPADDLARDSIVEPVSGLYLYVWVDVPIFSTAGTLNVYATEL